MLRASEVVATWDTYSGWWSRPSDRGAHPVQSCSLVTLVTLVTVELSGAVARWFKRVSHESMRIRSEKVFHNWVTPVPDNMPTSGISLKHPQTNRDIVRVFFIFLPQTAFSMTARYRKRSQVSDCLGATWWRWTWLPWWRLDSGTSYNFWMPQPQDANWTSSGVSISHLKHFETFWNFETIRLVETCRNGSSWSSDDFWTPDAHRSEVSRNRLQSLEPLGALRHLLHLNASHNLLIRTHGASWSCNAVAQL